MKLLFAILFLSTLSISCSKDDKDDIAKTENYFKVGDAKYELSAGTLLNYGPDNYSHDGYEIKLELFSKGLKLQIDKENYVNLGGKGHIIEFSMTSTTGEALDNGTYNFSSAEHIPIGKLVFGKYIMNLDFENETEYTVNDIAGGKVTVSKNGNEYTIAIDCTSEKGANITGYYKGKLLYPNTPKPT